MDANLYEDDLYTWTRVQVAALRRLAERRENLDADLDVPNLMEEIESLGSEQVGKVRGNLAQMLEHLIYLAMRPRDDAYLAWRREVVAFRDNAVDPYRRSMRRAVADDLDKVWRRACRAARAKLDQPLSHLEDTCPFVLGELLDDDAPIEPLIARLAPPEAA